MIKRRMAVFFILLAVLTVLGGCYDLEGGLIFSSDGQAKAVVGVKANEIMGGDEARLLAWQIDFIFPEVNLNYQRSMRTIREDYSTYLTILWEMEGVISLEDSEYFTFEKRADGSYEFIAQFPPVFESVSSDEEGNGALTFFVAMPKPIDMANTPFIDGPIAEWKITKGMLTTPTTLRAFTK